MSETIRVRIRLFALVREKAGAADLELQLPPPATVASAAAEVGRRVPAIAGLLAKTSFAVNFEYADAARALRDGDELAIIPAVSGGTEDHDWLAILAGPLPASQVQAFVADPAAGGIAVFAGTTRSETASDGRTLIALDYEAYEEMASRQFKDFARRCRGQWPLLKLVILHRTGRVMVGEPSVLIAVSTPHRNEAFAACRWLIDILKKDATIWKKEVWENK